MIQKREFLRYLEDNKFYELFIECGWNNPQGDTDLGIVEEDGTTHHFEQIAERNGFKIVKCEINKTPNSSVCRKIDHHLHRLANDYICIFFLPRTMRHLWLVPVNKTEKRDLVRVEYANTDQASFLYEKVSGFSFELGSRTTIIDVREKVQKAFIIDSERVTKKFYEEFRKQHKAFTTFITGIDDYIDEENKTRSKNQQVENKNKQWYASIMLNRLMFCYFIQRKRFLDGKTDYLRRKLQEVQEQEGDDQFYSFYRSFLIHLFHDGINTPRHDSPEFIKRYGRIPYLNGGLFGEHDLEQKYSDIDIADEAFEKLFDFFDQWNWHLDTSLTASGKDINPDVLGYIFEQYINDRAKMGAYYTKEDITEYIGRNTILPFLIDATKKVDERPFKANGEVWQFLKRSGDAYIFDDIKKGKDEEIPEEIANGIDTTKPNLLERRSYWNERTPEALALPTEIWRETIERLQRYNAIKAKIENGEITEINDFITYNLNIRQFVYDLLSKTEDHLLIKHFYEQLRKVTILDPTCGSGAFLFAAMNILEPLYEVCIDRMEDWHMKNQNIFKDEIDEIDRKYRSNRQYFIYKSIILRNLYGVDIMAEATEIAKLRLFLKMVAVVEVDMRADNLGLDPLPDIDFNIRCGNTLVGYATKAELERDLTWGDIFANQEFRDKIEDGMDKAAHAFNVFKQVQFRQDEDMVTFKQAKQELRERLYTLDDSLNQRLFISSGDGRPEHFEDWKHRHQPFHWLAEFYEIIQGNGGFDVIIGNPPYVEYNKKVDGIAVSDIYKLKGYQTIECGNLYAYVMERCYSILNQSSYISMIVPLSGHSTERMSPLVSNFYNKFGLHLHLNLSADAHPQKLFEGVKFRLTIFFATNNGNGQYSTKYTRWFAEERKNLFTALVRFNDTEGYSYQSIIPKIPSRLFISAIKKMMKQQPFFFIGNGQHICRYHNAPVNWIRSHSFVPYFCSERDGEGITTQLKSIPFYEQTDVEIASSIINSSLFFLWWICNSDCYHLNKPEISNFKYTRKTDSDNEICKEAKKLATDMQNKSVRRVYNYKTSGRVEYDEFYMKLSKPIIDEIDKVLAKHYGFSDEELDFIINYDIKYRMGDELNEE